MILVIVVCMFYQAFMYVVTMLNDLSSLSVHVFVEFVPRMLLNCSKGNLYRLRWDRLHTVLRLQFINQHIEAETKWPPSSRRHFQMDFLERKYMNFD